MRQFKTSNLSRSHASQSRMRTDEVKEKDKQRNQVVGRSKRRKALFGFVPSLELLVEALNQIVRNIVFEAFDTNMLYAVKERFYRHFVGTVTI